MKISLFSNSRGLNVCKEQLRPGVSNSEIGWSAKGASTLGGGGGGGGVGVNVPAGNVASISIL